jgi:tetratricopeptide (TPR) repeat protein
MKKLILLGFIALSTITYAQKNNTTNAAMEYKHYQENMMKGDVEEALTSLKEAKSYIDKSAVHETTVNDPKTLMYKGFIYMEYPQTAMMAGDKIDTNQIETMFNDGIEALKLSQEKDTKGKYEGKIESYAKQKQITLFNMGMDSYEKGNFEQAMAGFGGSAVYADILGITDSNAYFNAGLCAYKSKDWKNTQEYFEKCIEIKHRIPDCSAYLSDAYNQQKNYEAGEKFYKEALKNNPGNKDLMIALINVYLPQGKKDEAGKVLSDAIALDPENKELHYVVGTVYEGQENYKKAAESYKKVIEIDPEYTDAYLGLGAVYFNIAAEYNNKINELMPGDPKEDEYKLKMKENFEKSLPYLEKADQLNPNNKDILNSLKQVYYKLEMIDKYKETKAKLDALK